MICFNEAKIHLKILSGSIKRPRTPYIIFMQEFAYKLRQQKDQGEKGTFMTEVAKQWRDLSDLERQVYIDKAKIEQEEYARKLSCLRND